MDAISGSAPLWRRSAALRGHRRLQFGASDDGYAAIDALVALTILASTIVFAIAALQVADKGAAAALEARQARDVLSAAMDRVAMLTGATNGTGPRFTWAVAVGDPQPIAGGMAMCELDATAKALASGRVYRLTSARICPAAAAS